MSNLNLSMAQCIHTQNEKINKMLVSCHLGVNDPHFGQTEKLYGTNTKTQKIFPNTGSGTVTTNERWRVGMIKAINEEIRE